MKLIRWGRAGSERPGVILPDGRRVDASAFCGERRSDDGGRFLDPFAVGCG